MATIVNNPGATSDSSGTNGLLIAVVLVFALILFFWFYGMPYFRGGRNQDGTPTTNIENNVQAPEQAPAPAGDTNVNIPVPEKVDVKIEGGQQGQ